MYVQTTLDVHKKYNALVMSAFNNDAGFVAALDKVGVSSPACRMSDGDARSLIVMTFWCLSTGVRAVHQQQRRHPDGSVIQQVARAAGPILRLIAEEEVSGSVVFFKPEA